MPTTRIINRLHRLGFFPTPYSAGKAYEAWVFLKLKSLMDQSTVISNVTLRNHSGQPTPSPVVVRGGPGNILRAGGPNGPNYASYVSFEVPQAGGAVNEYEMHLGVQFTGRSGAAHEFDISIIPRGVGQHFRTHGPGRPTGHPRVGLELKKYGSNLDVSIPRGFIGALFDCSHWGRQRIVWPIQHEAIGTSLQINNGRGKLCIVTNRRLSPFAVDLCNRFGIMILAARTIGRPIT